MRTPEVEGAIRAESERPSREKWDELVARGAIDSEGRVLLRGPENPDTPEPTPHAFDITLDGYGPITDEKVGLFKVLSFFDECTLASTGDIIRVIVDTTGGSLGEAIGGAVDELQRAGFTVSRIEVLREDDPSTPGTV